MRVLVADEEARMKFSLTPQPGESGHRQWLDAMKMVAKLQGGIPPDFRKTVSGVWWREKLWI